MSKELKSCPFCGWPAESAAGGLDIYCSNQYGCLAFDCSMSAEDWNRRYVCNEANGEKVYAGDAVRGHVRLCNRNDDDPEYDEGIIAFDERGLIWRLRTGVFQKSIMANYDEIELIKKT